MPSSVAVVGRLAFLQPFGAVLLLDRAGEGMELARLDLGSVSSAIAFTSSGMLV
jgi:hypothetical protein